MNVLRGFVAPAVVLVALAGCTGNRRDGGTSTPPATTSSPSPVATSSAPAGTNVYVYQNAGLTATLDLDAGTGTLQIQNDTGRELAAPSFYLLDARDGRRVPATVRGGEPTANGKTSEFDVTFSGLDTRNIGLAVLVIGHDNYGAFVRQ